MTKHFDELTGKEIPEGAKNYGRQPTQINIAPDLDIHIQFVRQNRCNVADISKESFLSVLDIAKNFVKDGPVPESGTAKEASKPAK